ncbi:MAG: hypothetical protein CM15mP59_0030 [Flavobacteriaceae bacterium]|nr:MAG: hypothetical protein CM15mP59_0030 [Flavobacteriaceae bacterium]
MPKTISKKIISQDVCTTSLFFVNVSFIFTKNESYDKFLLRYFFHYKRIYFKYKSPSLMSLTIKLPLLKKGYTLKHH